MNAGGSFAVSEKVDWSKGAASSVLLTLRIASAKSDSDFQGRLHFLAYE